MIDGPVDGEALLGIDEDIASGTCVRTTSCANVGFDSASQDFRAPPIH